MTLPDGKPKGLEHVLIECGFDVHKMHAKCAPVCPFENADCCMAHLLSKQDDFINQESILETLIKKAGYDCIFLLIVNSIQLKWYVIFSFLINYCSLNFSQVLGMGQVSLS